MKKLAREAGAALLPVLVAFDAQALEFDGSQPFLCAPVKITSCALGAECLDETADSINLPQFLTVDLSGKNIKGKRPTGEALSSPILSAQRDGDQLVMQGTENALAWTVSVGQENGKMTIVAAGKDVAFVAFGACTRP
jgi:hypothetical protein